MPKNPAFGLKEYRQQIRDILAQQNRGEQDIPLVEKVLKARTHLPSLGGKGLPKLSKLPKV